MVTIKEILSKTLKGNVLTDNDCLLVSKALSSMIEKGHLHYTLAKKVQLKGQLVLVDSATVKREKLETVKLNEVKKLLSTKVDPDGGVSVKSLNPNIKTPKVTLYEPTNKGDEDDKNLTAKEIVAELRTLTHPFGAKVPADIKAAFKTDKLAFEAVINAIESFLTICSTAGIGVSVRKKDIQNGSASASDNFLGRLSGSMVFSLRSVPDVARPGFLKPHSKWLSLNQPIADSLIWAALDAQNLTTTLDFICRLIAIANSESGNRVDLGRCELRVLAVSISKAKAASDNSLSLADHVLFSTSFGSGQIIPKMTASFFKSLSKSSENVNNNFKLTNAADLLMGLSSSELVYRTDMILRLTDYIRRLGSNDSYTTDYNFWKSYSGFTGGDWDATVDEIDDLQTLFNACRLGKVGSRTLPYWHKVWCNKTLGFITNLSLIG